MKTEARANVMLLVGVLGGGVGLVSVALLIARYFGGR